MIDLEPRELASTKRNWTNRWKISALAGSLILLTACGIPTPVESNTNKQPNTSIAAPVAIPAVTRAPWEGSIETQASSLRIEEFCAKNEPISLGNTELMTIEAKRKLLSFLSKIVKPELLKDGRCLETAFTITNSQAKFEGIHGEPKISRGQVHHDYLNLQIPAKDSFEIEQISVNKKVVINKASIYASNSKIKVDSSSSLQEMVTHVSQFLTTQIRRNTKWGTKALSNSDSTRILVGINEVDTCRIRFYSPERPILVDCQEK